MTRGGSIRDLDELIEENRGGRVFRETVGEGGGGSSHSKIGRREPRSRGEVRRRDRKSKDSVGPLTLPTPDNLPKAFYQAPVILERKIQKTEATSSKQVTKTLEEINAHTTKTSVAQPVIDDIFTTIPSTPSTPTTTKNTINSSSNNNNNHIRSNSSINNGLRLESKSTATAPATTTTTAAAVTAAVKCGAKSFDKPFIKMVDDRGSFINNDLILKILSDLPGHFVVGVCGPQGVGKSTIISSLCEDPQNAFPSQTIESLNFARHETNGIDIHVTPERIILLDAQPVFSFSILEQIIRNDQIPDNTSPELWLEIQSLQLLIFLYSVCNVLIVVTENIDYTMWNYLKKAEMLKYRIPEFPSMPSLPSADIGVEYYPDIALVCNKTSPSDFTTTKYSLICDLLGKLFQESKLKIFGTLSLSKTLTMYKSLEDKSTPNLFLLPYENNPLRSNNISNNNNDDDDNSNIKSEGFGRLNYLSAPETFSVLTESLKNQIFELPKRSGKKGQVSEREWFRSAFKVWDIVRKSDFLTDYGKLAQKLREM